MTLLPFEFRVHQRESMSVLEVPSRVDVTNAQRFLAHAREATEEHAVLAVDLRHAKTVDSTALGAMVTVYKMLRARGGDLVLVSPGPAVRRVLAITRLDKVFRSFDSLEALALA